ncbi:MAG TPA: hypothetical protein VN700_08750 [Vicinamibacterales bacterium]|nr:hypothetical protein [Vicinamibacterales bacterium]
MGEKSLTLPDDFLGNVQKFLNTPPPQKKAKRKAKKVGAKK